MRRRDVASGKDAKEMAAHGTCNSGTKEEEKEKGKEKEKERGRGRGGCGLICCRMLLGALCFIGVLALAIAYLLVTRLGLGEEWARDANFDGQEPLLPESSLVSVAELPLPPGNLAVSASGQVFFSFHPTYNAINAMGTKIARLSPSSPAGFEAWPSASFQSRIVSVLSLRIDSRATLWLLDHCEMALLCRPTLYGISTETGEMLREHKFGASVAGWGSFLNDFHISEHSDYMYITDTSLLRMTPGIIVYDVEHDTSRRVLSGHQSMYGSSFFLKFPTRCPYGFGEINLRLGPLGATVHVDGVSISRGGEGETLYYSAVTSRDMYAVSTAALKKGGKAAEESVRRVSSRKPASDGQTSDAAGNVWMTAFTDFSLAVLRPPQAASRGGESFGVGGGEHELVKVVESRKLRWCDGLSFGPDGLYVTESALHLFMGGHQVGQRPGVKPKPKNMTFAERYGPFHIYMINATELRRAFGTGYELPAAGQ